MSQLSPKTTNTLQYDGYDRMYKMKVPMYRQIGFANEQIVGVADDDERRMRVLVREHKFP